MSHFLEQLGVGTVGLYMTYRAIRGFGYLLLGRPVYNMIRRRGRRNSVKWRHLLRQNTPMGKIAKRFEAHRYAAALNFTMAIPEPAYYAGLPLRIAGQKLFFWSIDAVPYATQKIMPHRIESMRNKLTAKRRTRNAQSSLHRRENRSLIGNHLELSRS